MSLADFKESHEARGGIAPVLCRVGSKKRFAKLLNYIAPPHDVYVEPFVGSGSFYWMKDVLAGKEVINDLDSSIASTFKMIKKAPTVISRYPQNLDTKDKLSAFLKKTHTTIPQKLTASIIRHCGGWMGKEVNTKTNKVARAINPYNKLKNIALYKERMKNTTVTSEDYEKVIKKNDSPKTFFFLDPPYEESKGFSYAEEEGFDFERLASVLGRIKGNFLMTINDSPRIRQLFNKFHIASVVIKGHKSKRKGDYEGRVHIGSEDRKEVLISNYKLPSDWRSHVGGSIVGGRAPLPVIITDWNDGDGVEAGMMAAIQPDSDSDSESDSSSDSDSHYTDESESEEDWEYNPPMDNDTLSSVGAGMNGGSRAQTIRELTRAVNELEATRNNIIARFGQAAWDTSVFKARLEEARGRLRAFIALGESYAGGCYGFNCFKKKVTPEPPAPPAPPAPPPPLALPRETPEEKAARLGRTARAIELARDHPGIRKTIEDLNMSPGAAWAYRIKKAKEDLILDSLHNQSAYSPGARIAYKKDFLRTRLEQHVPPGVDLEALLKEMAGGARGGVNDTLAADINSVAYEKQAPPEVGDYKLIYKTPGTVFYENNDEIVMGVAGTQGIGDAIGEWWRVPTNQIDKGKRYKEAEAALMEVKKNHPGKKVVAVGHSLGGTIIDSLLDKNLIDSGKSYNPAIQLKHLITPNKNQRTFKEGDILGELAKPFAKSKYKPKKLSEFLYPALAQHGLNNFRGGADVVMKKADYLKEHKRLIKILTAAGEEGERQIKELKGGTQRSDFLKKHKLEDRGYSLEELSKISGESLKVLKEVAKRGYGAYTTQPSSVRMKGSYKKGVDAPMSMKLSPHQWSIARVYSFLMKNPKHDSDLR